MLIPRHWASFRVEGKTPKGKRRVAMRYGWSDESMEAAQARAEERAREAMRRIESGEPAVAWRDRADTYGTEVVPIREEVVERFGDTAVTRNAYGALCLNASDVFFADVDLPAPERRGNLRFISGLLLISGLVIGSLLWKPTSGGAYGAIAGLLLGSVATRLIRKSEARRELERAPVRRRELIAGIENKFRHDDAVRIRIYETPSGLRIAAEHAAFDPNSVETTRLFDALKTDSRFARLCRLQRCFRARVSPKPWRCGHKALNRAEGGRVWPVPESKLHVRETWVQSYLRASTGYAACRLVSTVGRAEPDTRIAGILDFHDRLAKARVTLPLA